MTDKDYTVRRSCLINEFYRLKQLHLMRCAAARIRKIAHLDLEYCGTPIEKTKRIFHYDEVYPKNNDKERTR